MTKVVTNRVFLLGLDKMYRDEMQELEINRLLDCARVVAKSVRARPARGPPCHGAARLSRASVDAAHARQAAGGSHLADSINWNGHRARGRALAATQTNILVSLDAGQAEA